MVASRVRNVQSFVGVVLWEISRVEDVALWRVDNFRRVGTDARRGRARRIDRGDAFKKEKQSS